MLRLSYPGKFSLSVGKLAKKAGIWSHTIALLDLNSISRPEIENIPSLRSSASKIAAGVWRF